MTIHKMVKYEVQMKYGAGIVSWFDYNVAM